MYKIQPVVTRYKNTIRKGETYGILLYKEKTVMVGYKNTRRKALYSKQEEHVGRSGRMHIEERRTPERRAAGSVKTKLKKKERKKK